MEGSLRILGRSLFFFSIFCAYSCASDGRVILVDTPVESSPVTSSSEITEGPAELDPSFNPFDGLESGDDFPWGHFTSDNYFTLQLSLPIPIYLAFFSPLEIKEVQKGLDIANDAIGDEVFTIVENWHPEARPIYKVSEIHFDDQNLTQAARRQDHGRMAGYTYCLATHLKPLEREHTDRVIVDFAIEIKAGNVNRWVVAHELGHAFGIQEHAFFDEQNILLELNENSLMNAIIGPDPTLDDYAVMMQLLYENTLEYIERQESE